MSELEKHAIAPRPKVPAGELVQAVVVCLRERWPAGPKTYPPGLRLEMAYGVYNHLKRDPASAVWPGDLSEVFGLPVKITPEMPADTWRLVIIAEDVLLGGRYG